MKSFYSYGTKAAVIGWLFVLFLSVNTQAQTATSKSVAPAKGGALPDVKLVDEIGLKGLLVPKDKPLLVNFWATWCEPCREEFPDLVKLDNEFKGKIDFITISLDDPADIEGPVKRFLAGMKAQMPAYVLKAADEAAVIPTVSKEWAGGMPFTILYHPKGNAVYERQGKVQLEVVRPQIEKLVTSLSK
jgi:thiol-disulfide isomerase/thioredoxin